MEAHRLQRLHHLLRQEAAAAAVDVRVSRARLLREMEFERHDEHQIVLGARERHIQQPPLLLDELGFAGGELGRKAAVYQVQHVDRSEERRVGKECRSRWSRWEEKKEMG